MNLNLNSCRSNHFKAGVPVLLLTLAAIFGVVKEESSTPLLYHSLRGGELTITNELFVPHSLDIERQRGLSLDLGGGNCKWQPPKYAVPNENFVDFHKTIIAGFPSGDKRMIFIQMEALTGWPAKDEWDFEYLGITNHPFIKANYPHHEGIWGWGDVADQVVMMIRNIRRSMVEYHDILWDIGYAKTWEEATLLLDDLYAARPPIEDFLEWRDERVLEECHWYGWFIDYWMEGGLMRDMFTHKITTPEHWNMLMVPTAWTVDELRYDLVVGDAEVTPSYDPHCENGDVTDGCEPVAVISAEKLRDYTEGPAETAVIANVLKNDDRTGQFVIAQEAWDCIWEELIVNGKGLKTVYDRPGFNEDDYNFSEEMLSEMVTELDRLIDKYGGSEWSGKATANRVVELLVEHRALIQVELNEVVSGVRKLRDNDFLGAKERQRRKELKSEENERNGVVDALQEQKDHSGFFQAMERVLEKMRRGKLGQQSEKNVATESI